LHYLHSIKELNQILNPKGLAQYSRTLLPINDYADWLTKEPGTLRQFLIMQLSETHPNALANVLDALEHGRCLVLFDGLDEGFSPSVRRHVVGSISFCQIYALHII
jgi:predicted NACHT family NTPase